MELLWRPRKRGKGGRVVKLFVKRMYWGFDLCNSVCVVWVGVGVQIPLCKVMCLDRRYYTKQTRFP